MNGRDLSLLHLKLDLIARRMKVYKIEVVEETIRRHYTREDGADAVCVDYYPPWNRTGQFGKHKIAHEYIDYPWQIERFERWTGLTFEELPIVHSDRAAKRVFGRETPNATKVKRPFRLMIITPLPVGDENPKQYIRAFLPMEDNEPIEAGDDTDPGRVQEAESEEDKEFRASWQKMPWAYQNAYKVADLEQFTGHVSTTINLGDAGRVKKAIEAILPINTIYPSGQTRQDGIERMRLYWALVHLSSILENMGNLTQVEAIERARRAYNDFEVEKLTETAKTTK